MVDFEKSWEEKGTGCQKKRLLRAGHKENRWKVIADPLAEQVKDDGAVLLPDTGGF